MPSVNIEIGANPKPFESALDSMRAKAAHFGDHLAGVGKKVFAGFAAEKIFEKAMERFGESIEQFKEFTEQVEAAKAELGTTADEFQRVAYAAKLANVDANEFTKALLKIRTTANDAMKGDANAKELFSDLGLDAQKFAAADLAEQVLMLADSFEQLKQRGNAVPVMLEAIGTKNRSMLRVFERGAVQLSQDFAGAPVLSSDAFARQQERRERGVRKDAAEMQELSDSGAIDAKAAADSMQKNLARGAVTLGANIYEGVAQLGDTFNWLANKLTFGLTGYTPQSERNKAASSKGETVVNMGWVDTFMNLPKSAGFTGNPAGHFANATERAAMAEQVHEAEFRNSMLLTTSLEERASKLKGEQLRILQASTGESDKRKALGLMLKGMGMESEIFAAMKELSAPSNLVVKSGKLAEYGGGGPSVAFGGAELMLREQTDIQRAILAKLTGYSSFYTRDALTGKVTNPVAEAGAAAARAVHTVTRNFGPEGGWW